MDGYGVKIVKMGMRKKNFQTFNFIEDFDIISKYNFFFEWIMRDDLQECLSIVNLLKNHLKNIQQSFSKNISTT
jgi:hypothetical protein